MGSEEYQDVQRLSNQLYKILEYPNPLYEKVMAETIWPDKKDWEGKNRGDIQLQTWLFAKDLLKFRDFSREKQEELRNTCIELSREAQCYLSSLI